MTEAHPAHSNGGANGDDEGATEALGLAEWLCLAAADHRDHGPADESGREPD